MFSFFSSDFGIGMSHIVIFFILEEIRIKIGISFCSKRRNPVVHTLSQVKRFLQIIRLEFWFKGISFIPSVYPQPSNNHK